MRFDAERKLSDRVTLRNRFYFTELTWDSDGTLINGTFAIPGLGTYVARTLVLLDDTQKLLGDQLELVVVVPDGPVGHELLSGVELLQVKDVFTQDVALLAPLDLLNPVEPPGSAAARHHSRLRPGAAIRKSFVFAPYVVDRLAFSPRWQGFVGARLDVLNYEDTPSGTDRDDTNLSPLLGLVFAPTKDLSAPRERGHALSPRPPPRWWGRASPRRASRSRRGPSCSSWGARPSWAAPSTRCSARTSPSPILPAS